MKPGYTPLDRTISFEKAAAQQRYMSALCAKLHPVVIEVLKESWARHEADMTEADRAQVAEDVKKFLEIAATTDPEVAAFLASGKLDSEPAFNQAGDDEWFFNAKANHATPVIAGLWASLGNTDAARRDAGIQLLGDMEDGKRTQAVQSFKMITSRFGLNKEEASKLFVFLNDVVTPAQSNTPAVPVAKLQP